MLLTKNLVIEKIHLVIFTFENKGDILPEHTHGKNDVHISIVARGSFLVTGPDIPDNTIIKAGQMLDWLPGVYHQFEALEDNSRLFNIIKNPL